MTLTPRWSSRSTRRELLRTKLASPGWPGEHIAMGTNVDCYQRAEGRYELMRGIIAALRDAANPFSILTKGTLILRDLDLLLEAAEVTEVGLNVSAGFVDKDLWRAIEPGTPAPERRLEACATLNDSGLSCGVLMGPVVPYLSDSPAQLDAAVRQIAAAGRRTSSRSCCTCGQGPASGSWAGCARPIRELLPRYAELYGRGAYAPRQYQERITGQVRELAERYGIGRSAAGNRRLPGRAPTGRQGPAAIVNSVATAPTATLTPTTTPAALPARRPPPTPAPPAPRTRPESSMSSSACSDGSPRNQSQPEGRPGDTPPAISGTCFCDINDKLGIMPPIGGMIPSLSPLEATAALRQRAGTAASETRHSQQCLKFFDIFDLRALE